MSTSFMYTNLRQIILDLLNDSITIKLRSFIFTTTNNYNDNGIFYNLKPLVAIFYLDVNGNQPS